jgi:hypothetical protein
MKPTRPTTAKRIAVRPTPATTPPPAPKPVRTSVAKRILVLATVGRTDVQFVVEPADDGVSPSLQTAQVARQHTRAAHQFLLGQLALGNVSWVSETLPENRDCQMIVRDGRPLAVTAPGARKPEANWRPHAQATPSPWALYPRLLGGTLAALGQTPSKVAGLVFLQTARDDAAPGDRKWLDTLAGEPLAAGPLLAAFAPTRVSGLCSQTSPVTQPSEVKPRQAMWIDLLRGQEQADVEYPGPEGIVMPRSEVCERLDMLLSAVAGWAEPPDEVQVHHDGGLPGLAEQVIELANLRLPRAIVRVIRQAERLAEQLAVPWPGLRPVDSLRHRQAVRPLVARGQFTAAAQLAAAMQAQARRRESWVDQLQPVGAYMGGAGGSALVDEVRVDELNQGPGLLAELAQYGPGGGFLARESRSGAQVLFQTALRAEAAARAGEWGDVAQLLSTAFDVLYEEVLLCTADVQLAALPAWQRRKVAREQRAVSLRERCDEDLDTLVAEGGGQLAGLAQAAKRLNHLLAQGNSNPNDPSLRELRNRVIHDGASAATLKMVQHRLGKVGADLKKSPHLLGENQPLAGMAQAMGSAPLSAYEALTRACLATVDRLDYGYWR